MTASLRILYLEDDKSDVELVRENLEEEGFNCDMTHVETQADFVASLDNGSFDVILADYKLPSFDGISALTIAREKSPDVPFIFISGAMGEEVAIETLKRGATDYVLKQRLVRLVPAIRRALKEAEEHRERKQAEEELKKYREHLEELIEERTTQLKKINDKLQLEIAERKSFEDALRVSEEKYRLVSDFTYDWEDWLDLAGKYIYVSPSSEWITGYRSDEISDPSFVINITHPDDRELVKEHFREVLSGSVKIHHIDFRIVSRFGQTRWISHYCQPVYGKDGSFLGRRSSNRDISERKKAEQNLRRLTDELKHSNVELQGLNDKLKAEIQVRERIKTALEQSENRYRQMVTAVTAYTYSVKVSQGQAIHTEHSIGCLPVTGYSRDEFNSDPHLWYSMIYPEDRMMVENSLKEILAGHEIPPVEHRIIRRDGKVAWVRNTMVPHYDENRRMVFYDGLIEDITERKRAEEEIQELNRKLKKNVFELTEANKELDAFNHTVSHDLQNPLIVIEGFSRRYLKSHGDKLDTNEIDMLTAIQMSAQKMERLIKDLLAFSRSGRQQIETVKIDVRNLIMTVLNELKPLSEGRVIKFDIKTLPPAYGDVALVKQVFINLISNAIKFTKPKEVAVIEAGCRVQENETIYYVKDNGIGFNSQHADKLFSPFLRLHGAKEFEGTGLGLSIVQRIITRHGGRVWAEGNENEGATFYFSLPTRT